MRGAVSVGAGGGLLAAVRSGRVCRLCSLWAAGSSVRRWRCCWCRSASGWRCWWAGWSAAAGCRRGHRLGRAVTDSHRSGRRSGAAGRQQGQRREDGQKKKARADGAACAAALAFGLHWRQWFRRGASRCRWWALYPGILPALPGSAGLHLIRAQRFPLSAFQRHGWRWRCSIRVNFAVCRRGQILHLTGVRSRCRALT